jgi:hypothetical protein
MPEAEQAHERLWLQEAIQGRAGEHSLICKFFVLREPVNLTVVTSLLQDTGAPEARVKDG